MKRRSAQGQLGSGARTDKNKTTRWGDEQNKEERRSPAAMTRYPRTQEGVRATTCLSRVLAALALGQPSGDHGAASSDEQSTLVFECRACTADEGVKAPTEIMTTMMTLFGIAPLASRLSRTAVRAPGLPRQSPRCTTGLDRINPSPRPPPLEACRLTKSSG